MGRPRRTPNPPSPRPRHRPPQALRGQTTPRRSPVRRNTDSFPSGTAATAVLVLGLAIYFAGLHITHATACAFPSKRALTAAIIALSIFRLLAGEHYPSDVLAGWLAGALSLLAIIALRRRLRFKNQRQLPTLTPATLPR